LLIDATADKTFSVAKSMKARSLGEVSANEEQAEAWGFGCATGALEVGNEWWVGSFTGELVAKFARTPP
jgi:hypothetical protein